MRQSALRSPGRPITYAGDDLDILKQRLKSVAPAWSVYDIKLMMRCYQENGAIATNDDVTRLTTLLGHAPRSYPDFAESAAAGWTQH